MPPPKLRNTLISIFVVLWLAIFHYHSICHFYLEPFFKRPLPQMKFLFPPAGWIMFYNVGESSGYTEIFGVNADGIQLIDQHEILETRTIGFDNIHRNVLSNVLSAEMKEPFCRFLGRKFPEFDGFLITGVYYPSVVQAPHKRLQRVVYQCGGSAP